MKCFSIHIVFLHDRSSVYLRVSVHAVWSGYWHKRPLSMHAYLAEQLQDEASTVGISMIIKIIHNLVVLCHQVLVSLIVTAAKLFVHYAKLQLPQRSEGRLKVQTLRV